ncbi:MAG: hypothetical protein AB1726_16775 [Planctomycetota bacterium]
MTAILAPFALLAALARPAAPDEGFVELTVPAKPDATTLLLTSDAPASVVETRAVSLVRGTNRLRFDWSRERVDEGSVRFDVQPAAGTAEIAARTKIHRLGGMLYFDVEASEDTAATLATRYLLYGVGWRVDYVGLLPSEGAPDALALRLDVEVTNNAGKDLEDARVRFEGGEIDHLSLRPGERRQVEVFRLEGVPVIRRYLWDPARFGGTPAIQLEIENAPGGPIARELLPAGKIRIFAARAEGGPALLGEDVFPATPLGEKAKLATGNARDLVVERIVLQVGNENERRDRWNKVVAYDQRAKVRFKVRNGFSHDTTLTLFETPGAPLEIVSCSAPYERKKADAIEIQAALPAGQETIVEIEWLRKNLF